MSVPILANLLPSPPGYFNGYMPEASSWAYTTNAQADPSSSGANTLTTRTSSGITVTAAGSNLPGITFTPAASSSVYLILVRLTAAIANSSGAVFFLTDGSQTFATGGTGAFVFGFGEAIFGIYAPGTGSAVTVKIQALNTNAGGGGVTTIASSSGEFPIEWQVVRLS